jgi:TetR/AcrR family fatty acid metabolism transcriptional regulator
MMVAALKDAPRRRRREETLRRLMEAALSVFARSGFDRATVDEIVREAGFSKGAFYVHFETKDDLFWAMLEERISRQLESFRHGVDHNMPVADNIRTILNAVFGLVREDPLWAPLFLEFGAHAARNRDVRLRLATMYERWRELIVSILNASREAGRMRKDADPQFMATVLVATVEGSVVQSLLSPETVNLEEMVEPLTRTLTEWLTGEPGR